MRVIIKLPCSLNEQFFAFNSDEEITIKDIYDKYQLNDDCLSIISNGKHLSLNTKLNELDNQILQCVTCIKGGKGGFGSLGKGQPAVKKQTTNYDACRDISGRRIGHVNQEKQGEEWEQKKEAEEKIIQQYNSNNEKDTGEKVTKKGNEDKTEEINKENNKFFAEDYTMKKAVEDSMKYLNNKRKREQIHYNSNSNTKNKNKKNSKSKSKNNKQNKEVKNLLKEVNKKKTLQQLEDEIFDF